MSQTIKGDSLDSYQTFEREVTWGEGVPKPPPGEGWRLATTCWIWERPTPKADAKPKYFRDYKGPGTYIFQSYVVVRYPSLNEVLYQRGIESNTWEAVSEPNSAIVSALGTVIPTAVDTFTWTLEDIVRGCP